MKYLRPIIFIFLQVLCLLAFAQKRNIQFDHLATAQGLSQSNVFAVAADVRGFMWFGTGDGLNKYDGYSFKIYKNNPLDSTSLPNNYITAITKSKTGDLWIATLGGGISRYDRNMDKFKNYQHDPENRNSLCNDMVNSLLEDRQGRVWIATEAGLDVFTPATGHFTHFTSKRLDTSSLSDAYVRYVFEDSHSNIWVCTLNGGINLFHPQTNTFTRLRHNQDDAHSIGGDNVYTMFEDSRGRLWVGTDGAGLDLLDPATKQFTHFVHSDTDPNTPAANAIFAINEDAEKNLWIGTENGGLSILNYTTRTFYTYRNDEIDLESISNNSICSIFRDAKNNMWLGNFAGGVDLANRDKTRFAHYKHMAVKNSLSNNHVLSITEDSKENIWIGTDGGGVNVFDPRQSMFTNFKHSGTNEQSLGGDHVLTVFEDSKHHMWMGTWGDGISVYDPSTKTFQHYRNDPAVPSSLANNNAWKIFEDRDKNIWVGTFGSGLDLLNPDRRTFTHYPFERGRADGVAGSNVVYIFEDNDGEMWICTDGGGLSHFNKASKTFTSFAHDPTKNSISNNNLSSMMEDSRKNLWIATRRGLNLLDKKTGRFTVYTMQDGLPDNSIFGILEDSKKNLWISTNKGISCFNPDTKTFKNYGVSDGLQSNEFTEQAFCKSRSGFMYFGGNNGFNQFVPDNVNATAFQPPLVITNFQVFNKNVKISTGPNDPSPLLKSITETRSITLPYKSSVFSFEFASLNYTSPEKKQYAYMLENFDKGWNEIGSARIATYTNLDPGTYRFRVKGLNNEGNWSAEEASIEVIIKPPFWLTWWFRLALVLAAAGTVIGIYRIRVSELKAQRTKLQNQVHDQTQELIRSAGEEHKAREEAEKARLETEVANKELKLKNKELEQFAYVASHDLQEPLRTTSGFVELLQHQYHGKLDEKADRYLNFISDASSRMKTLINDLLDFSRIGTNVELREIDCNNLVKNMLADIMKAVQESKADIQYSELPVIKGYRTEVKLLFQNLVLNAIKFRNKEVPLQILISGETKDDFWQFAVQDNGIGIDKKHADRVFDIFQRLHTRKEYPGSGIGLAHCKKIVDLHKGKIWLESQPGQGTRFYFTIAQHIKPDRSI